MTSCNLLRHSSILGGEQRIGSQHQEFYFVVDVILINPYACKIEYDAPEQSVLIV